MRIFTTFKPDRFDRMSHDHSFKKTNCYFESGSGVQLGKVHGDCGQSQIQHQHLQSSSPLVMEKNVSGAMKRRANLIYGAVSRIGAELALFLAVVRTRFCNDFGVNMLADSFVEISAVWLRERCHTRRVSGCFSHLRSVAM